MDEEKQEKININIDEPKDNPPGQGQSKLAKKRRRQRLSIDNKKLPDTDPDSPTNDDVGSIPKTDPSTSSSSNPNKKKHTKKGSKFLGLEPTPLELKASKKSLIMLQAIMKIPPIPNGAFGVKIDGVPDGAPIFICDLPDSVTLINDKDEIEEVERPFYWTYARNGKAMSGNMIERGVDWAEENPFKASLLGTVMTTIGFVMAATSIGEQINRHNQQQNNKNEYPRAQEAKPNNNNEDIKVDHVAGVPMPRVD